MKKITLGVIPIVVSDGKILLLKRENPPFKGYWALPGGKIDFGEHPEETAVREIKEETGIDAKVVNIRGVLSEIVKDKKTGENSDHFVMFICEMMPLHTKIRSSEEGELKWFNIGELEKHKDIIVPSDIHIVRKIVQKEKGIPVHKSHMSTDGIKYYFEAFGK